MRRIALAAPCALLFMAAIGQSAPITPGNLVVYRVGTGSAALDATATPVFIDEYTPTGVLVQTIPLAGSGPSAVTATGNINLEGVLSLSQSGNLITFTGYRKDAGGSNPSTDTAAVTNRVVGTLDMSGAVNVSTVLTDANGVFRSAATVDGLQLWAVGATGVRYINTPYASSTTVLINSRNSRQTVMSGNVLYSTNGVGSIIERVQSWGTLPTAAATPTAVVSMTLTDIVQGMSLVDLDPSIPGDDTMYICSTTEGLIRKYTFDGTTWNASGSIASDAQNVFAMLGPGGVNLYLVNAPSLSAPSNSLFVHTDASGYGGILTGTIGPAIATSDLNTAFRGVAAFIPEPAGAALVSAAALVLRRSRRRG